MPENSKNSISRRIRGWGRGYVFTPKELLDLGSRNTVDVTLNKLASDGMIRRVARGIYDYPRVNESLGGELAPDLDQVALAIARRFRWTIIPDGAQAANMLGLSTQVPATVIYLSDGPSKTYKIGKQTVRFKHARPKEIGVESRTSGMVIQALRYLGQKRVDTEIIRTLRDRLSETDKRRLIRDARYSADWIYEVARKIAADAIM